MKQAKSERECETVLLLHLLQSANNENDTVKAGHLGKLYLKKTFNEMIDDKPAMMIRMLQDIRKQDNNTNLNGDF